MNKNFSTSDVIEHYLVKHTTLRFHLLNLNKINKTSYILTAEVNKERRKWNMRHKTKDVGTFL